MAAPAPWLRLEPRWEAAAGDAGGGPLDAASAAWRLLLLSDGSVTRHLQIVTGERRLQGSWQALLRCQRSALCRGR